MEAEQGAKDGTHHVIDGIVYTAIIHALISLNLLGSNFTIILDVANACAIAILVLVLGSRGIVYLAGWIFGIGLLIYGGILGTGLFGTVELIADLGIPSVFIALKIYLYFQSNKI